MLRAVPKAEAVVVVLRGSLTAFRGTDLAESGVKSLRVVVFALPPQVAYQP